MNSPFRVSRRSSHSNEYKLWAGVLLCIAAAATAMDPLRVQTIIDDMTRPHEARLSGVPDWSGWGSGPRVQKGNKLPSGWNATTAWGQIYREADKAIPSNTRVQIRNFEAYQLRKSDGKWLKLQDSDNSGIGGGAYVEDFADDTNKKPNVRNEGNKSLSVKLEYGYNYHFWPNSRALIQSGGIGAMFCVFEARLILDNSGGKVDRGQARLLAGCGGDYWRSLDAQWKSDWSNNGDFAGMCCIRTANDDKTRSGDRFLSFSVNRQVTVYVAYDNRVSSRPSWLSSWDNEGKRASISEAYPDGITVYSRRFDAGDVTLGGNGATEYESMYSVFVDTDHAATSLSREYPRSAVAPSPVRASLSGGMLRINGLYPSRAYTISLTDAKGRMAMIEATADANGVISVSASNRPCGVYIVGVRSKGQIRSTTVILP